MKTYSILTKSVALKGLVLGTIAAGLCLGLQTPALAREHSEHQPSRHNEHSGEHRDSDSRAHHRELRDLDSDWGYRAFIPDGGGGQVFYGDPNDYTNGNLYGGFDNGYDGHGRRHRPYRIYRHRDDYSYGNGLSVELNGDNFSLRYSKRGRPIYSAPDCDEYGYYGNGYDNGYYNDTTYYYGDGPIVIDGRPRYDEQGYYDTYDARGGDGGDVYYDNRSYDDNDTTNNYYGSSPIQPVPPRSQYIETPRDAPTVPVGPLPQTGAQPDQRTIGLRFFDATKLASSDGGWRLSIQAGKLYAGPGKAKGQLVASNVDERFGAYALWTAGHGLSLVYRSGADVMAASRDGDGSWYSEALPYNVDFNADNNLGLVSGDLWFTFSASDGLRYVVALRDGAWYEMGSASGVR